MLIGRSNLSINENGQLVLPPAYREAAKEGAFLTMGFDRNLLLIPGEVFQNILNYISSLSITDPLARSLMRFFLGNAMELSMDAENKISIPRELREFAGIEQELVVIGQGEYSEIWAPGSWNKQVQALQSPDVNSDRFSGLFIAVA